MDLITMSEEMHDRLLRDIEEGKGLPKIIIHAEQQKRPRRAERRKKPAPLPEPVVYYGKSNTKYPETIRLSFADGHTEIYDRRLNQPRQDTYVNDPRRKRK